MQIKTEIIFDSGTPDFTFSLKSQKYIELDGQKQYVGEPHRMAVTPLDMEQVKRFVSEQDTALDESTGVVSLAAAYTNIETHPIVAILDTLWTDEVKKAYETKFQSEMADEDAEK